MTSKFILFLLILIPSVALAQEQIDSDDHDKSSHILTLVMASAFIPNPFSENTNDILIVPVYGLNYDYQINKN